MRKNKVDERFGQQVVFGSYSSKGAFFKKSVAFFLGLFVLGFCFFEFYWVKRPEYAFKMLSQAIVKRDIVTFRKYVDTAKLTDTLFGNVLKNTTLYEFDENGQPRDREFFERTQKALKSTLVQQIEEYIEYGSFYVGQGWSNDAFEMIREQSGYNDAVFEKAELHKNGDTPIIVIEAYNRKFKYSYVLSLLMQKSATGDWQVTEINELPKYFAEYNQVKNEKLNDLNTPIRKTIAEAITVSDVTAELLTNTTPAAEGTEEKTTYTAMLKCDLAVDAAKPISNYTLRFYLKDTAGKVVLTRDIDAIKVEKPKAVLKVKGKKAKKITVEAPKTGLQFVSGVNDEAGKEIGLLFKYIFEADLSRATIPVEQLAKSELSGYKAEAEVVCINFSDGTQIKVLEELPAEI